MRERLRGKRLRGKEIEGADIEGLVPFPSLSCVRACCGSFLGPLFLCLLLAALFVGLVSGGARWGRACGGPRLRGLSCGGTRLRRVPLLLVRACRGHSPLRGRACWGRACRGRACGGCAAWGSRACGGALAGPRLRGALAGARFRRSPGPPSPFPAGRSVSCSLSAALLCSSPASSPSLPLHVVRAFSKEESTVFCSIFLT